MLINEQLLKTLFKEEWNSQSIIKFIIENLINQSNSIYKKDAIGMAKIMFKSIKKISITKSFFY